MSTLFIKKGRQIVLQETKYDNNAVLPVLIRLHSVD